MKRSIRHIVYHLLEGNKQTRAALIIRWFIVMLILLNTAAVILHSVERLGLAYTKIFSSFEVFSLGIFGLEYTLRIWSCVEDKRWSSPVAGRFRFAVTPMAIIDFLAIAPGFFPASFRGADLRFFRMVRLFRMLRLLKLGRYSASIRTIGEVLWHKKEDLAITGIVVILMIILSSSFLYMAEREAQPGNFGSIPQAMWWAVVTLTTVGYGDVYPVTAFGKVLSSIISILGIALFAMPTAILASGFSEHMKKEKHRLICPHCGEVLD